jgi:hypothetical protein
MFTKSATAISPTVSVANAAVKIWPGDGPSPDSSALIKSARNEFEAFQIIVNGPAAQVSVNAPTLVGPGGATIPGSEVRSYREAYLNITAPSNLEGSTGRWPDALIPDVDEIANEKRNAFPFDVPAGENRVVWMEVHVPRDQVPGTYRGSLAVTASGNTIATVPVTLIVWDFELPSTSSLASTFGMGWSAACVAHYGSYEACGYDAGVERMHLLYARFFLDHRITVEVVYTGPVGCTPPNCDWSHFDSIYGALFDGTDPNLRLKGAKPTSIRYIWTGSPAYYAEWARHFRQKGWFDRVYDYTCDEPPDGCSWSTISTRASMVHGADPEFRTLVTTNKDAADANGVLGSINIISPVVRRMEDKPGTANAGNQRSKYDAFLQSNPLNHLWWYQSCMSHSCSAPYDSDPYFTGWPSVVVDTSSVQNRAQGILSWLYNVTGVLYYETVLDLPTAWDHMYSFTGNGDGTLVFAGRPDIIGGQTHIPVAGIRLKMIREGFEDYEYMKLVSDLGDPAFALQTGRALFPNTFSARQSADALYAAREALANRILALKSGNAPSNIPTVNVTAPANGSTVSGVIAISATASDANGISGVQFLLDGNNIGNDVTTAPYSITFDTRTLANGSSHSFAARARNNLNMTATSVASVVTVNDVNPAPGELAVISPLALFPASPLVNESVTATFTIENVGGQPVNVTYFLAGGRDQNSGHVDFPVSPQMILQPGQRYTYRASRSFATVGAYSAWPAFYDGTIWYELGTHTNFTVTAGAPVTTRFEENDSRIVKGPYQWSWPAGIDCRASGCGYLGTSAAGSTLQFNFTGTGISWIGIADSCSGMAKVDIDGAAQTVDAYRATGGGWQKTLYTASGLPQGPHTFTLSVLGTKNPASCASFIYVDALDVVGLQNSPAPTRLEENNPNIALGPEQWSWPAGNNCQASGCRYVASATAGTRISLNFTGTGISVIGTAESCSGQARVQVDGNTQTIDAYRRNGAWQQVLYSVAGLPKAQHMFTLTVLGTKNPSSCAAWIYFDALDIQD